MWFYWVLAFGLALVFAGGIFFGGIYTLILVPKHPQSGASEKADQTSPAAW